MKNEPVAWYNANDSSLSFKNHGGGWEPLYSETLIRQQQAEIEALKKEAALQRLSDFTQESESFDRTASHMAGEYVSYSEPVAWISVLAMDKIGQKFTDIRISLTKTDVADIPLYTHPAEHDLGIAEAIGFNKGYQAATTKTLTDEEILKMAADKFHYSEYKLVIDFAKAILRKAQEK
jgi:hypothetical protein